MPPKKRTQEKRKMKMCGARTSMHATKKKLREKKDENVPECGARARMNASYDEHDGSCVER